MMKEKVLNYDWNDLMKTMIKRGSDIKIIVNQKIRKIIIQTMYGLTEDEIKVVENV
jgi:hypothetical protein